MDTNLTRAESVARAALIDVRSYRVSLDLTDSEHEPAFPSTTTVRFSCSTPGSRTWIDLMADEIESVVLNGVALDASSYDGARLALPDLAADNELTVHARCSYMTTGEGLHRLADPADGSTYLYTQFATAEARRVLACFEQPDLKARFTWQVIAPAGWAVLSNSPTPRRAPGDSPATSRWDFPETPPLPTYLAALSAGPFEAIHSEYVGPHGSYPLGIFVRRSMAEHLDAGEFLDITRAGLAQFEREFGLPYPFEKYDQVLLPEFNFGAMENPGLVIFREELAVFRSRVTDQARENRAMVILHEMAHMWFGNLVTMQWWDDLWLNESFATWAGFRAAAMSTRFRTAWTSFALSQKAWAYRADQLPSTHPVSADVPDLEAVYLNFDGITYAKGASVLKQLVAFVGLEAFLDGLRTYFEAHAWGNATLADLLAPLSAASGRDLDTWARVWLTEAGVTTLRPVVELDEAGRYRSVRVEQLPATHPEGITQVLRPHRIAVGAYRWDGSTADRRLVRDLRVEVDVLDAWADVPALIGQPAADLLLVNDDDLTYAKVGLDAASLATARFGVGSIADPLARALVWGALWEQVRDGMLPAQDYVEIALAALVDEDQPGLIDSVRLSLRMAITQYLAVELREPVARSVCAATGALLDSAEPGSDRQLALVMAAIESAVQPHRLAHLADLLDGRVQIPGLPLDDDLRWAVVLRLAQRGVASAESIDEVLAADRTSSGEQAAARARAAIPTREAKARAWEAAIEDESMPNALLVATVGGFSDPDCPAGLLEPFRERYFAQIANVFAQSSPARAQALARGLFPSIDQVTLDGARTLLADPDLPTGLRRILAECSDDVERALRCRAVSRAAG